MNVFILFIDRKLEIILRKCPIFKSEVSPEHNLLP